MSPANFVLINLLWHLRKHVGRGAPGDEVGPLGGSGGTRAGAGKKNEEERETERGNLVG